MSKGKAFAIGFGVGIIAFMGFHIYEQHQEKEIINSLMTATFKNDTSAVLNLLSPELKQKSLDVTKEIYEIEDEEAETKIGEELNDWISIFDTQFGKDWTYDYEIKTTETLTHTELEDMKVYYQMSGVEDFNFNKAKMITVEYRLNGINGETGTNTIPVCLIRQGLKWSLGYRIGTKLADALNYKNTPYDIYGVLLNGYTATPINVEEVDTNTVDASNE